MAVRLAVRRHRGWQRTGGGGLRTLPPSQITHRASRINALHKKVDNLENKVDNLEAVILNMEERLDKKWDKMQESLFSKIENLFRNGLQNFEVANADMQTVITKAETVQGTLESCTSSGNEPPMGIKLVPPSSRAILPTPAKAPTIGSSNRASPSSKRATGGTGCRFGGNYQNDEGYVYWASSDNLRVTRSDRGSRGFPLPHKGACGPPHRDKCHWANPLYRVELAIDDSELPSPLRAHSQDTPHQWYIHDGVDTKVMSLTDNLFF